MTNLRFTPYAWAKLIFMRDQGSTEVAGYGVSSIEDPLLVTDFMLVKQESSAATFDFDDEGLADYVDDMIDLDFQPAEFLRIWIHTHPGNSASPSSTDETTFAEKFSDSDWAIMFILAKGGETTTVLKYKQPQCRINIPNSVDFNEEFGESRKEEWKEEYKLCVKEKTYKKKKGTSKKKKIANKSNTFLFDDDDWEIDEEYGSEEDLVNLFTTSSLYNKGGLY